MSINLSSRSLKWIILGLVLANLATLAIFWLMRPPMPMEAKGSPKEFLIHELNFNQQQKDAFFVLVKEHQDMAGPLRDQIRDAKQELFHLISQPNTTDSSKQLAAEKVSAAVAKLDILTVNHFEKVRAMCTDEQKIKFDGLLNQISQMMSSARPMLAPPHPPKSHNERK